MEQLATTLFCPQCGAAVDLPAEGRELACAACGSTLMLCGGVPVRELWEEPRLDGSQAEQTLRASFGHPPVGLDVPEGATIQVGELEFFPFLRVLADPGDRVLPLADLPLPELADLAEAPAVMVNGRPSSPAGAADLDQSRLETEVERAVNQPGCRAVMIERRGYYPLTYSVQGERFDAVVSAGQGAVCLGRLPAVGRNRADTGVLAAAAALMLAEALFVPGWLPKVIAVVLTGAALLFSMTWLVDRRGR